MSTLETVRAKVAAIARAPVPDDVDASLFESGVIDSWGVMDLVSDLEETFGVKVPDEDLLPRKFETLRRIADYFDAQAAR
jgi:acyl carrier protein